MDLDGIIALRNALKLNATLDGKCSIPELPSPWDQHVDWLIEQLEQSQAERDQYMKDGDHYVEQLEASQKREREARDCFCNIKHPPIPRVECPWCLVERLEDVLTAAEQARDMAVEDLDREQVVSIVTRESLDEAEQKLKAALQEVERLKKAAGECEHYKRLLDGWILCPVGRCGEDPAPGDGGEPQ